MTTKSDHTKKVVPRRGSTRRGTAVTGTPDFYDAVRQELIDFARPSYQANAGFGWLDSVGKPTRERPQFLYITCRMTYVAALEVARTHASSGPDYDRAVHGINLLTTYFKDDEYGGWFTALGSDSTLANPIVVDNSKRAYPHAFVVLAAATAKMAGVSNASSLLTEALTILTRKFWDTETCMLVEDYNTDFSQLDPYRGANSNMHGVEALLAAFSATKDRTYLTMAEQICDRIVDIAEQFGWRLPEHFTATWDVTADYNADNPLDPVRPFGSTPGHWSEWARLLLHLHAAQQSIGEDPDPALLTAAEQFFEQAFSDAWAINGQPGLLFTVDFSGEPLSHTRLHWVTCEAIGAARALHLVTGDDYYSQTEQVLWAYADKFLIDHRAGSWHHELDGQNQPAQSIRQGKADIYHAYQAAMLAALPLRTTICDALLETRKQ